MELTNVEKETYEVLGNRLGISMEEFGSMPSNERNEWVESCRVAKLLNENKGSELYEGYYMTSMFDEDGNFSLENATDIIRSKKKVMDVVKKYVDFTGTLPQFILLGEEGTHELVNEALKEMNSETARDLEEGKVISDDVKVRRDLDRDIIERARRHVTVFSSNNINELEENNFSK